jgi:hypothetical protein
VSDTLTADQAAQLGRLIDVYPEARELGERFAAAGHELHLVGGTVRDTLLAAGRGCARAGRPRLRDLCAPEETERIVAGWATAVWLTGAAYGTVSCQREEPGRPLRTIEITTYRSDRYQPGSRHPEVTYGERIEEDLARRDLTVNAMAVRVPEFSFVDPFGGLGDLRRRLLRTPIDPGIRSATTRCGWCGSRASRPCWTPKSTRRRGRRDLDGRAARDRVGRADPRRARQADRGADTGPRDRPAGGHRSGQPGRARADRAARVP